VSRITGTLHKDLCAFMVVSCSFLLIMGNVTEGVEKIKTHILGVITFFLIVPFMRSCGKILLSLTGYTQCACALHAGWLRVQTHTLRICNTYCFLMATMVARTCRFVMFISVHCLFCFILKFLFNNMIALGTVHFILVYSQLRLLWFRCSNSLNWQ
jgi:hypothetical protein